MQPVTSLPTAEHPALQLGALELELGLRRLRLDQSCTLRGGRLYLVVGPSGSGKSSFARALLGFGDLSDPATRCRGKVVIVDASGKPHPLWTGDAYNPAARSHIALLPQAEKLGFIDALSV